MSRFLSEKYKGLKEYVPGEQPKGKEYIKLNTNELPYLPSDAVFSALDNETLSKVNLYPDPDCAELKEKLAAHLGVSPRNICLSNGSDEALAFVFLSLCGNGAVFPDITYGFYRVFSDLFGVNYTEIPLNEDFSVDLKAFSGRKETVIIANPNAPTGIFLAPEEIETLLSSDRNRLVVIDEAYIDFGGKSCIPLLSKYDNLLIVRTFSKSVGVAGARFGYLIGAPEVISDTEKIRNSINPYNINRLTEAVCKAALSDIGYYDDCCEKIRNTRDTLSQALSAEGFVMTPSLANFIFARHPSVGGRELYLKLKERGILIRHFDSPRISDYNRITVGTPEQTAVLIKTIKDILNENKV